MIKLFLTTLARQLWRNRLYTFLNILGLSVCISVAWVIFRMVDYEYSYDSKIPDAGRIYQVYAKDQSSDGTVSDFTAIPKPALGALTETIPGVELAVPMFYKYHHHAALPGKEKEQIRRKTGEEEVDVQLVSTTPDYFRMFPHRFLAGNAQNALDAPDKVILTDAKAAEYFPGLVPADVIGKTIIYDDSVTRRVSAVIAAFDFPNSFEADDQFIAIRKKDQAATNWTSMTSNDQIFVMPSAETGIARIMDQLNKIYAEQGKESFEKYKYKGWFEVFPLSQKHLETRHNAQTRTADRKVLNGLIITAAFLLLLACINYINLSTAQLPQRAREIGIRKTLGSSKRNLVLRFIVETLVVTSLAALLSFGFTAISSRLFHDFLPEGLHNYMNYVGMIAFMGVLVVAISVFSGLYPAWLSARVNTVNVLKGVTEKVAGRNFFSLRKGLIIFQFLIAQVFIIGSIIIREQMQFSLDKNPGFNKEGMITVQVPDHVANDPAYKGKITVLKEELGRSPALAGAAVGDRPMDNTMLSSLLKYYKDTTEIQAAVHIKFGDKDYLPLYGFKLLAGRNFMPSDTMNEIIINQKALEAYGWGSPEEAIGKTLVSPSGKARNYPIVGVVSDFHQFGFQTEIKPGLITTQRIPSTTLNIRLPEQPSQWAPALRAVEQEWKKVYAGVPFKYTFYDETIGKFYESEKRTQKLVIAATSIAILISCLGLFGLATLTAFSRTKEIGVRKVLGASVFNITRLLSLEFLSLVLISVLIASPVAWWMMNKWLQDFVFRIEIQWWIFVLAAMAAAVIALLTVSYQAIRAAVANPVKSLRTE